MKKPTLILFSIFLLSSLTGCFYDVRPPKKSTGIISKDSFCSYFIIGKKAYHICNASKVDSIADGTKIRIKYKIDYCGISNNDHCGNNRDKAGDITVLAFVD